jgi:large conductance mechanosensitive channel
MLEEFRQFALKGSVIDLAVGIIIGAAFNRIVGSLVEDIIMPIIGFLTGGLDFTNYFWQLVGPHAATYADAKKAGATIGYGTFITLAINFLIVAWIMFLVITAINSMRRQEEKKPAPIAEVPADVKLLEEIRNLLAEGRAVTPAGVNPQG